MPTTDMGTNKFASIMKALDVGALPEDEQEEVLAKLGELVLRDTLVRCLSTLGDKEREEFAELTKDGTPDDVAEYLIKHVPDADKHVEEAFAELTDDILAVTA